MRSYDVPSPDFQCIDLRIEQDVCPLNHQPLQWTEAKAHDAHNGTLTTFAIYHGSRPRLDIIWSVWIGAGRPRLASMLGSPYLHQTTRIKASRCNFGQRTCHLF